MLCKTLDILARLLKCRHEFFEEVLEIVGDDERFFSKNVRKCDFLLALKDSIHVRYDRDALDSSFAELRQWIKHSNRLDLIIKQLDTIRKIIPE